MICPVVFFVIIFIEILPRIERLFSVIFIRVYNLTLDNVSGTSARQPLCSEFRSFMPLGNARIFISGPVYGKIAFD